MLENLDLAKKVPKQEWQTRKLALQDRLYNAAQTCWDSNTLVCVIFEGWDTAGKGTCIKYITERQEGQKKRLRKMEKSALAWKVTAENWRQNKRYNQYYTAAEEMSEPIIICGASVTGYLLKGKSPFSIAPGTAGCWWSA